jgi:3-hydroxyacyl-CoA dehydrogenase/3-hydroxy-2-methylbutyryl-CoA dehydrogenase
MKIEGMTAVVSGGASGLGEACSRYFVDNGAKVGILDMAQERGEALAAELGDNAIFCNTNVADTENVQAAVDKTFETFGAVHTAVSCAGVPYVSKVITKKGPLSMDLFNKTIQINLNGTMNVIRSAAEKMMENTPNEDGEIGVVINCSSGAAYFGQIGQAAYSASKAGIIGMTLPIAREFADYGIRVNTIAPGLFETPMIGQIPEKVQQALISKIPFPKRMGKAVEFAMLCGHIIENPMLNGETIKLDAAYVMQAK